MIRKWRCKGCGSSTDEVQWLKDAVVGIEDEWIGS